MAQEKAKQHSHVTVGFLPRARAYRSLSRCLLASGLAFSLGGLFGCTAADGSPDARRGDASASTREIRGLTVDEALADFDQLASAIRGLYGALERKEQRYGFNFETVTAEHRTRIQNARSESEFQEIFQTFIASLKDAHVSLSVPFSSDDAGTFTLPFLAMPAGDTYVIYAAPAGAPVAVGDELLTLDGRDIEAIVSSHLRFAGVPNALTAKHIATLFLSIRRPFLSKDLSDGARAELQVRKADGTVRNVSLAWARQSNFLAERIPVEAPEAGSPGARSVMAYSSPIAELTRAGFTEVGVREPFFMTPQARAALGVTDEVRPSDASLAKFGLSPEVAEQVRYFAVTYRLRNQSVLLVRIPDYAPSDANAALAYLRALLDEQQPRVDALVLDQTHNPGGSLDFAAGVSALLTSRPANGFIQQMHADRLWIQSFGTQAERVRRQTGDVAHPLALLFNERAHAVDEAYSSHQSLSAPLPFFFPSPLITPDPVHWTKPMLLLADELSVSCADFVPLFVKSNGLGRLFGQRTMGGGGNVERVGTLTHSQAVLQLSRGVGTLYDPTGTYPEERIIEDNGVEPDVLYSHTLEDVRAGYVGYIAAFNREVQALLRTGAAGP